jgi:hypothetical protein
MLKTTGKWVSVYSYYTPEYHRQNGTLVKVDKPRPVDKPKVERVTVYGCRTDDISERGR